MTRVRLVCAVLVTATVSACAATTEGRAVDGAGDPAGSAPTVATAMPPATRANEGTPTSEPVGAPLGPPTMGVTPTLRETVPADAAVCLPTPAPGRATPVAIADPAAPRIVVSLPTGWNAAPNPAGVSLIGPDGMVGDVEITETDLEPAAAFEKYADDLTALAPISSLSVLPADDCGYSGQRMTGVLSGGAQGDQTFEDRVAHVWTNTNNYLVAIHVGAPEKTPAFDAATPVLVADYAITIP